jgi:hypothetical protein
MKESVDVEESGEQVTRITSAIESGAVTGAMSGSPLRLTHVTTRGVLARIMNIDSSATSAAA